MPLSCHVPVQSAFDVTCSFRDALKQLESDPLGKLAIATSIPHFNCNVTSSPSQLDDNATLTEFLKSTEARPEIDCRSATFTQRSGGSPNRFDGPSISYKAEPGKHFAEVHIDNSPDKETSIALHDAIRSSFDASGSSALLDDAIPAELKAGIEAQRAAASSLSSETTKVGRFLTDQIERSTEFIRNISKTILDKQSELDEQYKDRVEKFESDFAERVAAFERQKADHDARSATILRRESVEKLETIIASQSKMKLSWPTQSKRIPIHLLCIGLLGGFGTLAFVYADKLLAAENPSWQLTAPLSTGLLGFAATVIYYLKWNDNWFTQHASAEVKSMRNSADIIRANWLAELMFEWDKEKAQEFPDSLIATFSQGLFHDPSIKATDHPTDEVLRFMKSLKKISVTRDGAELDRS